MMSLSNTEFYASLAGRNPSTTRPQWYLSVIACLAALNYPEEVASLYTLLLKAYIPKNDHLSQTRKIREALTILTAIIGAAKIGTALRSLSGVTPDELRDGNCYRKGEDHQLAVARGAEFISSIYGEGNERGKSSQKASPDYDFIMKELLYAHVISFPAILSVFETGQVIVSALLASGCSIQASSHMSGMMRNGATKEEVSYIRDLCVSTVGYWGFKPLVSFADVPALPR